MRSNIRRPFPKQRKRPVQDLVQAIKVGTSGRIISTNNPLISDQDVAQIMEKVNPVYLTWPGSNVNYFILGVHSFNPSDENADWILG